MDNESQNVVLAELQKDVKYLCETVTRVEKKLDTKVDKEMYNMSLISQTRRTSEIDRKVDKAWEETQNLKMKQAGILVKIGLMVGVVYAVLSSVIGKLLESLQ